MKLVVIAGHSFPNKNSEQAGIFIFNRCESLFRSGTIPNVYLNILEESKCLLFIRYILKRKKQDKFQLTYTSNFPTSIVVTRVSIFDKIKNSITGKLYLDKVIRRFSEQLNSYQTEMIHAHFAYPEGFLGVSLGDLLKVPVVITAHGSDVNVLPRKSKAIARRIVQVLEAADKSIFVSNRLLENAKKLGYKGDNAVVIPNGIKSEYFNISRDRESRLLARGETRTVGFVGNLIDIKRADKLPRIFLEIRKMRQDTEFIVVGDGELRRNICKQCEDYQLPVNFVGRVLPDQVPNYMNLMDVLVLPSRNEGWPCVVLEAQACGVPVVGSDNGGIPEAIGEGGSVVPDGENFEERFAKAVVEILKNPIDPQELRKRAVQFDWSITVGKEIEVYRDVLSNRKSAK